MLKMTIDSPAPAWLYIWLQKNNMWKIWKSMSQVWNKSPVSLVIPNPSGTYKKDVVT